MFPILSASTFALGLLFPAYAAAHFFVRRARSWGLLDIPGGRRLHLRPVAEVGGLVVISTWLLGGALFAAVHPGWARAELAGIGITVACVGAILVLGLCDDRRDVSPRVRLGVELAVAAFTVFCEPSCHRFCAELAQLLGPASFGLTALGIVAVMNSVNLMDGLDGLAASVLLAIAACIAILGGAFASSPSWSALSALALLPGLAMFLRRNWSPATIFLGDHGSLAVGYLLAVSALGIKAGSDASSSHSIADLVPLTLLFGYPVLDMLLCMVRRFRTRQPIFAGDRNHLHHRTLRLGLAPRESALALLGWQLAMLSPVLLVQAVPIRFMGLLLVPPLAIAWERLYFLGRIEAMRLGATQGEVRPFTQYRAYATTYAEDPASAADR